ncbi:hypothetical protein ACFXHA_03445 [Nocardia sp. NPDC059240]|uniref:hypothetical protein n=1 Tax=Nocardia sp. NPDC059240 TaxID=3346786 RepID=UPI0036B044A2
MPAAIITASASIIVAVLAFLLNQRGQLVQEQRRARLERISSQLCDLYGPLHAWVEVNERIWEALRATHLPTEHDRRPDADSPIWREWRDHALLPANRKMRDLIVERADLLSETGVPEPLLTFCAHVSALEVTVKSSPPTYQRTLIRHPGSDYITHVRETFAALKAEQHRLLDSTTHS